MILFFAPLVLGLQAPVRIHAFGPSAKFAAALKVFWARQEPLGALPIQRLT
jgi:hypothetical protein